MFKGKIYNEFIHPKQVTPRTRKNPYDEISEDSDENEKIEEIQPVPKKNPGKAGRTSVSAEVYGVFNKKSEFTPKVIPKTPEQISRIQTRIKQSFLFSALDAKDLETVLNAFEEVSFK